MGSADGALIFRTNCAMCHNFAGKGGALTRGKYAPNLTGVTPKYVYEAMVTGPQSMPVFNDQTIDPQAKKDVIAYLQTIEKAPSPGRVRARLHRPGERGPGRLGGRPARADRLRGLAGSEVFVSDGTTTR